MSPLRQCTSEGNGKKEDLKVDKIIRQGSTLSRTSSQRSSFYDRSRLDYLIKIFPKFNMINLFTEIDLKHYYNARKTRLMIIDVLCSLLNFGVIFIFYLEVNIV
jgi:hypothetical protein